MSEPAELYTIGQVARRVGVPARTIRFWCDAGVLTPTDRAASGYRRYDATAVARLDLIRTLRDLGLGLGDIRQVLDGRVTLAEVASTHAAALDTQIRVLRLHRAVLRVLAARGSDTEEAPRMNDLARLSARERQQIIDEFVADVFAGVTPDDPATSIAQRMRTLPAELPASRHPQRPATLHPRRPRLPLANRRPPCGQALIGAVHLIGHTGVIACHRVARSSPALTMLSVSIPW